MPTWDIQIRKKSCPIALKASINHHKKAAVNSKYAGINVLSLTTNWAGDAVCMLFVCMYA